jgi:L-amino acid N-acyltransferase YncA
MPVTSVRWVTSVPTDNLRAERVLRIFHWRTELRSHRRRPHPDATVEAMRDEDWEAVQRIYREGIATGDATFETEVPEWEDWDRSHARDCRLVARREGQVVGWAALSPVSARRAYAGVAEVSIYVAVPARGQGVGKALLRALIEASERRGFWTLQAGIFPENEASIALHRACGFRIVGHRERLGRMCSVWRDVVLMERRSEVVGV